jgi:2-dehydro-3-deoxyphosphooctonate aldolase (KDO 8-P synthase)
MNKDFPFEIGKQLTFISGPCVIEGRDAALFAAERLSNLFHELKVPFIYKSSFDKANRSSIHSFRGPGLEEGLKILQEIKQTFGIPVLSDIHLPEQALPASEVLDVIQIPAFLARQTDLLVAAAKTRTPVNVKKGQFMAPWDMKNCVHKLEEAGATSIILTDRGTTFGYNNLVADMRGIPEMKKFGYPVCFDASHSVQLPAAAGTASSGQKEFIPVLARAAVAAGADMIFVESHPCPEKGLCDATSMISFSDLKPLIIQLQKIFEIV